MILYHQSWYCSGSSRRDSKPGAPFCQSGMTCWLRAANEPASATMKNARRYRCMGAHDAKTICERGRLFRRRVLVARAVVLEAAIHRRGFQSVRRLEQQIDVLRNLGGTTLGGFDRGQPHLLAGAFEGELLEFVHRPVVSLLNP